MCAKRVKGRNTQDKQRQQKQNRHTTVSPEHIDTTQVTARERTGITNEEKNTQSNETEEEYNNNNKTHRRFAHSKNTASRQERDKSTKVMERKCVTQGGDVVGDVRTTRKNTKKKLR